MCQTRPSAKRRVAQNLSARRCVSYVIVQPYAAEKTKSSNSAERGVQQRAKRGEVFSEWCGKANNSQCSSMKRRYDAGSWELMAGAVGDDFEGATKGEMH